MATALLAALAEAVGSAHVLDDPALRVGYERDWTGRWSGEAAAVVRPGSTAEVSAVVRACAALGAVIVPQGGNTGLVGGGVPRGEVEVGASGREVDHLPEVARSTDVTSVDRATVAVVLSTTRLTAIGAVDTATAQLPAGAGVTLAAAQAAARAAGLDLPLDLAARDGATLGGLAACDAGGLRALRHGTARRQIAGLEAVLADGSIIHCRMHGLVKDTAGYDLGALLVGSEGTLGIITSLRWSLIARRDARAVALVALDTIADAVALVGALRSRLPSLEVCELMEADGVALTCAHLGVAVPGVASDRHAVNSPGGAVTVLLGTAASAGGPDPLDELAAGLDGAGVADRALVAADAAGAARLFAIREAHAEALAAAGRPVKLDVGVGLGQLPAFRARLDDTVSQIAPTARTVIFGHLADGNLHVNILVPAADEPPDRIAGLEDAVLALVAECGGTVSAEHGIGVHKLRHLALVRSGAELAAMRAIKRALDPTGLLNPGVAVPAP